jgi:hypothetical protein
VTRSATCSSRSWNPPRRGERAGPPVTLACRPTRARAGGSRECCKQWGKRNSGRLGRAFWTSSDASVWTFDQRDARSDSAEHRRRRGARQRPSAPTDHHRHEQLAAACRRRRAPARKRASEHRAGTHSLGTTSSRPTWLVPRARSPRRASVLARKASLQRQPNWPRFRLSGAFLVPPDQDFGLLEPNLALPRRSAEPKVRGSNPLVRVSEGALESQSCGGVRQHRTPSGNEAGSSALSFWRCHSNPRDDRRVPPVSNLWLYRRDASILGDVGFTLPMLVFG